MADAETLLMETSEQNGNEGEDEQNGAEMMAGDDAQEGSTDGGKIDASKGEEDAGWVKKSWETINLWLYIWVHMVLELWKTALILIVI